MERCCLAPLGMASRSLRERLADRVSKFDPQNIFDCRFSRFCGACIMESAAIEETQLHEEPPLQFKSSSLLNFVPPRVACRATPFFVIV